MSARNEIPKAKEVSEKRNAFVIILRHILKNMKAKSSTQKGLFRGFFPDVCRLRSRHIGKYVHATEHEITF